MNKPYKNSREKWAFYLTSIADKVNYFVERVSAVFLLLMVATVWLNILSRYIFLSIDITFAEEASRYLMIWGVLLAISCGVYRSEHINFQLVINFLPHKVQQLIIFFLYIISFGFFYLLFIYGLDFLEEGKGSYASIFGITMYWPYLSIPVFALLSMFYLVLGFIVYILHLIDFDKDELDSFLKDSFTKYNPPN